MRDDLRFPPICVAPDNCRLYSRGRVARRLTLALLMLAMSVAVPSHLLAAEPSNGSKEKAAGKPAPSKERMAIEAAGIMVLGGNLSLPEEVELRKSIDKATKQKKALVGLEGESKKMDAEIKNNQEHINKLKGDRVQYSAQLANVTNVVENNQLVGALNALSGQIELAYEQQKTQLEKFKDQRKKASEAREEYVEQLMNLRLTADTIKEKWTKLAADPDLQAAVAAENKATGGKGKLAPSASFIASEKQLEFLEHTVLSESIPLVNEKGGMWVDVVINSRHTNKMLIDSGASCISLPYTVAKAMGIEATSKDEEINVSLADGSVIKANKLTVDEVRVGKFVVKDVEVIVLKPDAVAAPNLLGMSFLGNFKFEVDQQKAELRMVKVDVDDPSARTSKGKGMQKEKGAKK